MNEMLEISRKLKVASRITVLTGAGISTASGIKDFRSRGGYYDSKLPLERILSESYFNSNPRLFWEAYKSTFQLSDVESYEPNDGHKFLKVLEMAGKEVVILTQNVDGLHQKAGSSKVYEMHGTLFSATCSKCKRTYNLSYILNEETPRCQEDHFILKPDIVLFEGKVKHMEFAYNAVCESDVFLVVGSSLEVYPVSDFPSYIINAPNIASILINREPTKKDGLFQYVIHADINKTFKNIIEAAFKDYLNAQ